MHCDTAQEVCHTVHHSADTGRVCVQEWGEGYVLHCNSVWRRRRHLSETCAGEESAAVRPQGQDRQYHIPPGIDSTTTITIGQETFECRADDLKEEGELGRGAYGSVYRMRQSPTDTIMAANRYFL